VSVPRAARAILAALVGALALAPPAAAHHVGTWTPRDNEISSNFKQLKFALQERKLDVARRLYEGGAVRKELARRAAALLPALDGEVRAALGAGDAREAERGLVLVLALLIRDLALEAEKQVGDPAVPAAARAAAGQKFLEAIWRYYNLIDFAVTQRDPKAATGMRLAFDDAESVAKGTASPVAGNPCAGPRPASPGAPDPDKMLEPLRRIARILSGVIETFATPTRRQS
jgi:hypothetical protein